MTYWVTRTDLEFAKIVPERKKLEKIKLKPGGFLLGISPH